MIDEATRKSARVAGLALLIPTAIVMFANLYLTAGLYVPGDAAETARNIMAHEGRFRIAMVCNLFYVANVAVLLSALYVLLSSINRTWALTAALLRLVFVMMWAMTALNMLEALAFLGDAPYLKVFGTDQLQALARMDIGGNHHAYYVGLPFYALASTICSWLWFKSGYVPRALAGFGVIASAWCVFCAIAYLVDPGFGNAVNPWWFDTPMVLVFEVALGFWLLFKGVRSEVLAGGR
jgi:hypothetical protein